MKFGKLKRFLSGILCFAMIFSLEVNVFAEEEIADVLTEDRQVETELDTEIVSELQAEEAFVPMNGVTGYAVPFTAEEMAAYQAEISNKASDSGLNSAEINDVQQGPTEEEVYQRMMALKPSYPEGMRWTNDDGYEWNGGIWSMGYGCAGFAFILSDAAFGYLPARRIYNITIADVRVGDILRVNNDSHSVIITEVHDDYVVLAEGNYNSSIHWGRIMSAAQVAASDYVVTRYPATEYSSGTGYKYIITKGNEIKITSCSLTGDIVIPQKIDGYIVTSLQEELFYNKSFITSVSIPATVGEIDLYDYLFSFCTDLREIIVDEYNPNYCSCDGILYSKDKKTLYNYPCAKKDIQFITLPETTFLCCTSFARQYYLKYLFFGNPNCTWGTYTFLDAPSLTVYYLPGSKAESMAKKHINAGQCHENDSLYPFYKEGTPKEFCCVIRNDFPEQYEISVNPYATVKYEFTPEKSGEYLFFSEGDSDVAINIYDSNGVLKWQDDDSGDNRNFSLKVYLEGGKKYFLEFISWSFSTFTLNVQSFAYDKPFFIDDFRLELTLDGIRLCSDKCDDEHFQYLIIMNSSSSGWFTTYNGAGFAACEFRSLKSGKEYEFALIAYDQKGPYSEVEELFKEASKHSAKLTFYNQPYVNSVSAVSSGVQVKWNKVEGAANYRVFRKTEGGTWSGIANTTANSYVDTKAKSGTKYYYAVRITDSNGSNYNSLLSNSVSITYISQPNLISVCSVSNGVQIKWDKVAGAANYRVFRKTEGGTWTGIKNTTSTSCIDSTVKSGEKYYYSVRCTNANGSAYTSLLSKEMSVVYISQPKLVSVSNLQNGVQIKWNKVEGAPNYRVFRKTENGNWSGIANTTATTYVDTKAQNGVKYWYTVRVTNADGSAYISTCDGTGMSITCTISQENIPVLSSVASGATGVSLKWNPVSGAAKYRVFRRTEGGTWKGILNTTATEIVDKTAESGIKYFYAVRCTNADGSAYTSLLSKELSVVYISQPKLDSVTATATGVKVEWNSVSGAAKYRVFRKTEGGSWSGIANTSSTTYIDTNAKKGVKYWYTVRCTSADGKTYTSSCDGNGLSILY